MDFRLGKMQRIEGTAAAEQELAVEGQEGNIDPAEGLLKIKE